MTISDLVNQCSYQDVERELSLYYDNIDTESFQRLYWELRDKKIKHPINTEWHLYITARRMQDDGVDPVVDSFDENDKDIYFDVSIFKKGSDLLYSICSSSFEDFLQYVIDENVFEKFTSESILAHALWELTSYSFEDKASS